MQECGPRMLTAAFGRARARRLPRHRLRSPRSRVGCSPALPSCDPVMAAGIPAIAGVPVLEEDVPAGQNQARPPMYEMGGLARPRRATPGQLPGFAVAARRPQVPGTRARGRSPGSSHVPGSPPRWCPFPTVKAFLLPPRTPHKSLKSIISGSPAIHTVSTKGRQLSAPVGGYPPVYSQPVHKLQGVTPGTPAPAVAFGTFSSSSSAPVGFWHRTRGGDGARKPPVVRNPRGRSGQYGGALAAQAWPGRGGPVHWRLPDTRR
jgi:hypothetical protein